ncbi:hypothetical protein K1719_000458 [Acacia pycnantha]|nr:hypothetical protein K1719_000458 [Acacia pycnantha]
MFFDLDGHNHRLLIALRLFLKLRRCREETPEDGEAKSGVAIPRISAKGSRLFHLNPVLRKGSGLQGVPDMKKMCGA